MVTKLRVGVELPRLMGEQELMLRNVIYMIRVQALHSVQGESFALALVHHGYGLDTRPSEWNVVTNEAGVSCIFTAHSEEERTVESAKADMKTCCYEAGVGEPIEIWIAETAEYSTEDELNDMAEELLESIQNGMKTIQLVSVLGILVVGYLFVKGWL